jgi:hypothetical protein
MREDFAENLVAKELALVSRKGNVLLKGIFFYQEHDCRPHLPYSQALASYDISRPPD